MRRKPRRESPERERERERGGGRERRETWARRGREGRLDLVTGMASKRDRPWRPFRILLIPGIAVARYRTRAPVRSRTPLGEQHPWLHHELHRPSARARARAHCAQSSLGPPPPPPAFQRASLPNPPRPAAPPPNPGRTDLPPLRSRTTSLDYRRNLCAPVVIKMRHLLAAPASVSVHLPATRAAPLGRTRTTRTRRVVVLVETKKELHWGPS